MKPDHKMGEKIEDVIVYVLLNVMTFSAGTMLIASTIALCWLAASMFFAFAFWDAGILNSLLGWWAWRTVLIVASVVMLGMTFTEEWREIIRNAYTSSELRKSGRSK